MRESLNYFLACVKGLCYSRVMLIRQAEAAKILGVSRQRVTQLIQQGMLRPAPDVSVAMLDRAEVEKLSETWSRKPGRPSKAKERPE
jgi:hypothetical protein